MTHVRSRAARSLGLIVLAAVAATVTGCMTAAIPVSSTPVEPVAPVASAPSVQPASEPDAIDMAVEVLGDVHSYETVMVATDQALIAGGRVINDDTQRKLWSSVLQVAKGLTEQGFRSPDGLEVVECIPGSISSRGVDMVDAVAYCSLEIAGDPESQW